MAAPHGVDLEVLVTGAGAPTTVFAHGLGGGIADTRPLGSGVAGTRVFLAFRGHGTSTGGPVPTWTYADLATDLAAVADAHRATRALGVSLGAGALCRLVARDPVRFDRLVLFLPAVLDTPRAAPARQAFTALADAVDAGDAAALEALVGAEVPASHAGTPAARAYVRARAASLRATGSAALRALPDLVAVDDVDALRAVTAPTLVLGCEGDPLHPVEVAERLASVLPHATLHVHPTPGVLWTDRPLLRARIAGFLAA